MDNLDLTSTIFGVLVGAVVSIASIVANFWSARIQGQTQKQLAVQSSHLDRDAAYTLIYDKRRITVLARTYYLINRAHGQLARYFQIAISVPLESMPAEDILDYVRSEGFEGVDLERLGEIADKDELVSRVRELKARQEVLETGRAVVAFTEYFRDNELYLPEEAAELANEFAKSADLVCWYLHRGYQEKFQVRLDNERRKAMNLAKSAKQSIRDAARPPKT